MTPQTDNGRMALGQEGRHVSTSRRGRPPQYLLAVLLAGPVAALRRGLSPLRLQQKKAAAVDSKHTHA